MPRTRLPHILLALAFVACAADALKLPPPPALVRSLGSEIRTYRKLRPGTAVVGVCPPDLSTLVHIPRVFIDHWFGKADRTEGDARAIYVWGVPTSGNSGRESASTRAELTIVFNESRSTESVSCRLLHD